MNKGFLLSGVAAVALLLSNSIAANAADIAVPEEPIIADVFDWSGLYIGAHAGAGAIITEGMWDEEDNASGVNLGDLSNIGGVFGGQVGFNFQTGNLVFGIEGDISWTGWDDTAFPITTEHDTTGIGLDNDFLASVRGRLGWADDNVLFYVTGGVAWFEGDLTVEDDDGCDDQCSLDISETGGVVGAGIEWAPWQNVTIRAEGLYYFFDDDQSLCRDDNDCTGDNEKLTEADSGDFFELDDALVARLGINFLFNPF
jgi:outer membrane immunogenic protein